MLINKLFLEVLNYKTFSKNANKNHLIVALNNNKIYIILIKNKVNYKKKNN